MGGAKVTNPMRVLITNERLERRAGSDLFIRDLARGLQQRGHFVIAYSSDLRERPRLLELDSIPVATDLENLPFRPDIIHARHHLDAMSAVMALPGVPAVHHCIGTAWDTALPKHPRIHRYIAPSEHVSTWISQTGDVPRNRIDTLLNGIDLTRFQAVREPPASVRRILIYDDRLSPESDLTLEVTKVAAERDLQLDCIGRCFSHVVDSPERRLLDQDLVFANGRNAIEALASGCAVAAAGQGAGVTLIDEDNFDQLRAADFLPDEDLKPGSVAAVLDDFSPATSSTLAEKVRSLCDFVPYVERIDEIYRKAIEDHQSYREDLDAEQIAVAAYLQELAPRLKHIFHTPSFWTSTASMVVDVESKLAMIEAEVDRLTV